MIGSAHADTLTGDAGDNRLEGGAGADIVEGLAGADILDGGEGVDLATYASSDEGVTAYLDGTAGSGGHAAGDVLTNIENLIGSAHADILTGDAGDNIFDGGAGADNIDGGAGTDLIDYASSGEGVTAYLDGTAGIAGFAEGDVLSQIENINGSAFDDYFIGDDADNFIRGRSGNDIIDGGSGNDRLDGGNGDDILIGGAGADSLNGRIGSDTASYIGSDAAVHIDRSIDTAIGGHATGDSLGNIENLIGSEHDDTLTGNSGSNILEGGAGADTLNGLDGVDTVSYASSDAGVQVSLSDNSASGGHATGDVLSNFENLTGSAFDDVLTGNDSDNYITAGAGNDMLEGGAGADTLDGSAGGSNIAAYTGSDEAVHINLADGTISGGHAAGDIYINIHNVTGSSHDDLLTGNDNNNRLGGGAGADTLRGGAGFDTLEGGAGADILDGGSGDYDYASYASSDEGVTVNLENGTNSGGHASGDELSNIENLTGSAHADRLTGDENGNNIHGGAGNDILDGGAGGDRLDGDEGADTVTYHRSSQAVSVNLLTGQVSGGFAAYDHLLNIENLIGTDYNDSLTGNAERNTFEGGAGSDILNGGDGEDMLIYISSDEGVTVDLQNNTVSGGHADGDVISHFEHVTGSAHNDSLTGNGEDNFLKGGAGADFLDGGDGTDTTSYTDSDAAIFAYLDGTIGSGGHAEGDVLRNIENITGSAFDDVLGANETGNRIDGHGGINTVSYASSDAAINIHLGNETASGGYAAGDQLRNINNIIGSAHNDSLTGDGTENTLDGGAGNDTIKGWGGNDTLIGGAGDDNLDGDSGDDILMGGAGADRLDGDSGNDTVSYAGSNSGVNIHLSNRTASGGDATGDELISIENIIGSSSRDYITGDSQDNRIEGGAGNDTIKGAAGADFINGGSGNDAASYTGSGSAVNIDLGADTASGGHATGDVLDNIENLIGSDHGDDLRGNSGSNILDGGKGGDDLDGGSGTDTVTYIRSNAAVNVNLGNDTASGGDAAGDELDNIENLIGSNYHDRLTGKGNNNQLEGGRGNDILNGWGGNDVLLGGVGDDRLDGGDGRDRLDGGNGNDTASYAGSKGAVTVNLQTGETSGGRAEGDELISIENLIGSSHSDRLTGDEGANWLGGGDGNDILLGGDGADRLDGDSGNDTASYAGSDAGVEINLANDSASGGHAAGDNLNSIESLIGSAHNDTLTGDAKDNVFEGGAGNDTLTGGAGADRFVLGLDGSSDTVSDFSVAEGDKIRIDTSDASETTLEALGLSIQDNAGDAEIIHNEIVVMRLTGIDAALITDDSFGTYFEVV